MYNFFSGYIDKVRSLQQENNRLTRVVEKYELTKSSEVTHIKEMYDKQVEDLKAALDNMNKQYNQLKVGAEGLLQENTDIKNNLQKKDADVAKANDRTRNLEDEMRNMANQLSLLDAEKCKLAHQLQVTILFILLLISWLASNNPVKTYLPHFISGYFARYCQFERKITRGQERFRSRATEECRSGQ